MFPGKTPVRGCLGNPRSISGCPVTGLAGLPGTFKKFIMPIDPRLAVHVMHSVRAIERERQTGPVAGRTFDDHSVMALNRYGRKIVVGFTAGPDSMGAAMARLTRHAVMPQAVSKKGVCLFREPFVGGDDERGHIGAVRVSGPSDDLVSNIADGIPGVA